MTIVSGDVVALIAGVTSLAVCLATNIVVRLLDARYGR